MFTLIQSILRESAKELNRQFVHEPEDTLVLTDIKTIAKLMELCHKDGIVEETSLLPENADDQERAAFRKIDCSNNFDKLLICAAMLVADGVSPDGLITLGTEAYPPRIDFGLGRRAGYSNPYDYSWFDEESEVSGMDCMDYLKQWYFSSEENREHFLEYYEVAMEMQLDGNTAWELSMQLWS